MPERARWRICIGYAALGIIGLEGDSNGAPSELSTVDDAGDLKVKGRKVNMGNVAYLPLVHGHVYRLAGHLFVAYKGGSRYVAVFRGQPRTQVAWVLYRVTEVGEKYPGEQDGDPQAYVIFADGTCWPFPGERGPLARHLGMLAWVADSLNELRAQVQQEENRRFRAFMTEVGW